MSQMLTDTLALYRNAFRKTGQSLVRGWMTMLAVVGFGFLLVLATQIASPLGMIGGFVLGAVNALLVGATLSLIEQSIRQARAITFQDIVEQRRSLLLGCHRHWIHPLAAAHGSRPEHADEPVWATHIVCHLFAHLSLAESGARNYLSSSA